MLVNDGGAIGLDRGGAAPELRLLHGPSRTLLPVASFVSHREGAAERFREEVRGHRAGRLHLYRQHPAGLNSRWPAVATTLSPAGGSLPGLPAWRLRLDTTPSFELTRPSPGDRMTVGAVRRRPALVAAVTAGSAASRRQPGADPCAERVIALLYGAAGQDGEPVTVLEETRSERGLEHFAVSTPAGQAARILDAWLELEEEGPAAVSVHVVAPGTPVVRHFELALLSGVARMSRDGRSWERSVPEDDWADLFEEAVTL